jgi:hypothetical protein
MDIDEQRERELEYGLLLFEPTRLIKRIRDVGDIYAQRHLLKQVLPSVATITHLTRLIHEAIAAGRRFRVFESLKVLRVLLVSGGPRQLPHATVSRLFGIYQELILDSREEVEWCLSRLIKDQILHDEAVSWLLDHWTESVHVINRLLRYPVQHPRIVKWAEQRYREGDLDDRRSEVIAILLPTWGLNPFLSEKPETLGWAIMQCAAPRIRKIQLIRDVQRIMPSRAVVTYAVRLNAPIILRAALKDLRKANVQR